MHHGVEGQKWGVRRYQNADGSLTPEGRQHYGLSNLNYNKKFQGSRKEAKKAYLNERKKLYKDLNDKSDFDQEKIDFDSWQKYETEFKKKHPGEDPNPDEWDFDWNDKQTAINEKNVDAAKKYIDGYLASKYGDLTVNDVKQSDINKAKATVLGMSALLALPVIGLGTFITAEGVKAFKRG